MVILSGQSLLGRPKGMMGASVSVYSYDGKLVHQQENILTSSYQFELKGAPGLYIVEIQAGGKASRQKLIKSE